MNRKYVIVKNNINQKVIVCKDPEAVALKTGETLHEVSGRIRVGEAFEVEPILGTMAKEWAVRLAIAAGGAGAVMAWQSWFAG